MTTPSSEQTDRTETARPDLRAPLLRFRIAAIVTGIGLLVLVAAMVIRYGYDNPTPSQVYSPIHGALYLIYLALAIDLGIKARWSVKGIVLVLLAGCVPFVSFVAERVVTQRVHAGVRI